MRKEEKKMVWQAINLLRILRARITSKEHSDVGIDILVDEIDRLTEELSKKLED